MNIEGVQLLTSAKPGPAVTILAGVHGNETCGLEAFDDLIPNLRVDCGSVYFVRANPRAIDSRVRQVDMNLNRAFREESGLGPEQRKSYERARALEIMEILDKSSASLDIHSSATNNSTPFIICEPRSFSIAKYLPFDIVSSGWDAIEPGGTDYYMNKRGGSGICIECGYHLSPTATLKAKESILSFLKILGLINRPDVSLVAKKQRVISVNYLYITKVNFVPANRYADFELLHAGQLIGHDGPQSITAPTDCRIIFCRERERLGEEAFILGRDGGVSP